MGGPRTPDEILAFYALGLEQGRLDADYFPLERARTQELVLRHLAPPPGVVLDVGGAAGAYAFWLADAGYEVHLVDPVPLHVEQALAHVEGAREPGSRERAARRRALAAFRRCERPCRPDARAALSPHRTRGPVAGARRGAPRSPPRRRRLRGSHLALRLARGRPARLALRRPGLRELVERDLAYGQHRNDTGDARYFTTAFFHHPAELAEEIAVSGLTLVDLFAVEGSAAATMPDFPRRWADPTSRERLLTFLRAVESEPTLLGVSPHLLAVARRP